MYKAKLWVISLLLWTSLTLPSPLSSAALPLAAQTAPVPAAMLIPPDANNILQAPSFMEAVQQWIKQLAGEPGYTAWKQATWSGYSLGPGTHGWIVLVQSEGRDVGYMVIHAADPGNPNKYQLTEYGSGGKPLFSLQTLYRSLVQLELIHSSFTVQPWYVNPLYALWIVESGGTRYYLDAGTGESLPLDNITQPPNDSDLANTANNSLLSVHTLKQRLAIPSFDPYEKLPWIQGVPASFTGWAELQDELQQQHRLTFTAELYEAKLRFVAAVIGFHQWSNDEAFLLLEQNGQRAIPYSTLSHYGHLFRNSP
ncbi:hypothetical protein SAMN03159341_104415 [Paenibacillus sp. 1_12]|uniref:hypothetical protein n=1 Tax=Paenibacillus sp. 1_12 TaxID=1566278 RepID=UPI0008E9DAFD|nr:hypothetical protein [Paenibacillus sp. 1_12]SFL27964.1 hypothetical protein SAMN03159341_104415 [Paenibacillus sp. 1_12]